MDAGWVHHFFMSLKITKKLSEWYGLFWLMISEDFIYANLALFLLGLCMIRQITVEEHVEELERHREGVYQQGVSSSVACLCCVTDIF